MNEIIQAIYDRLELELLCPDIFDHVPQDYNVFPYVAMGSLNLDEADTDSETGFLGTIQITSFSRYRGMKEVSDLNVDIYSALHRWGFPDTASFGISGITQEFSTIALEVDSLTRVSIQRFRVIFEPLP